MDRSPGPLAAATLRWLGRTSNQGVFTTDRELRVQGWNGWIEQHTGRLAADLIGRPLFEAIPELVERGLDAHYHAALAGESRVLAQTFHRYFLSGPAGAPERAQTARIAPLEADGEIIGTITVVEDVSERVARERELRHQIETAEFARAMAEEAVRTKDEFLATLSHEIRTPLNAVVGWTKILQARGSDAVLVKRGLEVIERNAMAQMHLIDDMLDMARIMTGKLRLEMQPIDAAAVVRAALDVIAPAARAKGLNLESSIEPGEHRVTGDPDRLQQVFWNLLSNAVKFTESGGTIRTGLARDEHAVRVWISDSGVGIDEEFLPHMFERFRQAHASSSRRHGGLGLGLPLVKQLVELHGGVVSATSVPRAGSVFTVILPLLRSDGEAGGVAAAVEQENLVNVRILVLGDEDDGRELTATMLRHYGVVVGEASTGGEAVAAIDAALAARQPYDAVLAEVGGGQGAGYELLGELQRRPPSRGGGTPVIALASYAVPRDRQRALAAGFRDHLVRPFEPAQLASSVRKSVSAAPRRRPSAGR